MAILGKTTLISGECYGILNVGATLTTKNISLVNKGLIQTAGVKGVGDDLEQKTFFADGTVRTFSDEVSNLLGTAGGNSTPIYVDNGVFQACSMYDRNGSEATSTEGIPVVKNNSVILPGDVYLYQNVNGVTKKSCRMRLGATGTSNSAANWNVVFESTDTTNGSARVSCDAGFFQTSDIRKKENLKDLDLNKCYELIDKCQTVLFDYKEGAKDQMGMIAQEVEEFFPEIVATDEKGFKSLDYAKLTVVILRVLKDLIKKVNG